MAALVPGYGPLFASRVIAAVANAGFWAAATATVVAVVPANRRGRAMAIVTGGLTVATVLGVPAGAFLGQHAGWRSAFWAVAALSALVFVAILLWVPAIRGVGERIGLRAELRTYRKPRLWLALGIISISTAALLVAFSYLSPLLTEAIGLAAIWVPAVLVLYGIGALAGIRTGGRFADKHPIGTIIVGNALALAALAVLAVTPPVLVAVFAVALLGFGGFVANPALNVRVFALAETAPSLAGASAVSAFNVGIVLAPWLGGRAIDAGLGYLSVAWLGIGLAMVAIGATVWAGVLERRAQPALTSASSALTRAQPVRSADQLGPTSSSS